MKDLHKKLPGLLACLAVAVPAWLLGKLVAVAGSAVFAILLGMLAGLVWKNKGKAAPGIAFTSKKILQLAVVLLGFGMDLGSVARVGGQSLPIILSTISVSLLTAYALYRLLGLEGDAAVLIGVGSSICGGSAIAATAPVIGADDDAIAQAISVIFLFNVIAALVFPPLGEMLGLSDYGFGLFAGTAVNDTSSVTAAASAWDQLHGTDTLQTAAIVKMTRTLAIIPITLALALRRARKASAGAEVDLRKIFPWFVALFLLASLVTTLLPLPGGLVSGLKDASKFFITMAMAAIGLNTDLPKLIRSGAKPILLGLCCWVAIAATSLGMQRALGLW